MTTEELVKHHLNEVRLEFGLGDSEILTDTVIYGTSEALNSLQLVRLVVDMEQAVFEQFNKHITIANEKALSLKNSPFRTVGTMSNYIDELINE